jgi:hypothetical protein
MEVSEENKQHLINEYNLIQEKKSNLSAKQRLKVCEIYKLVIESKKQDLAN